MSYYDDYQNGQASWQPEPTAFAAQFEEIERATDNLMRSGKWPMPKGEHHRGGSRQDFERPGSAGLQGYYAGQRHPVRQSEAEQVLQAKRRMAAQRERELRNYHQEQQYNRKPDRSMSPNSTAMSEEDRRELIARQHRALYGENSNLYQESHAQPGADTDAAQDPVRASTTSPHEHGPKGVAPIGTRPPQGSSKRSNTPLTPSSLSYGYSSETQSQERSASATSNSQGDKSLGGWGNNSGVWGKPALGSQASVWG